MLRLIPRDERFFDLLDDMASKLRDAAALLHQQLEAPKAGSEYRDRIKTIEHECDLVARDIIQRIHRHFVTPIDREDLHRLAMALEETVDTIHVTSKRMVLYGIEEPPHGAVRMASLLAEAAEKLERAVRGLRNLKEKEMIRQVCRDVATIERRGDYLNRQATAQMLELRDQPLTALKWKDVLEALEAGLDSCEEIADTLEEVLLKNS